ncbi:Acyl-n-acyltransferase protein [Lasiodiplodia theobromae]|uniref:Acyl-n-acyltransferase protein n=1 Tax=Lasiodiplodia theobromae TaxID=45133 RepID=UPI0015C3A24A|nr:Acyl-n-acyltransferase protein [Lasiodiplodia theobromae]KAF4539666.1 Acyl-n-acyltransferase protein [Lasiodiplodia theobromae]
MTHCDRPQPNNKQQHSPKIRIRATASPAAAPAIVTLGKQVTTATLGHAIPAADLQANLAEVYTVRAVAAEIIAPNKTMLVATAPMSSLPALASSSSSKVSVVNYAIAHSALSSSSSSEREEEEDYGGDDDSSDGSAKGSKAENDLQILLGFALLIRHHDSTTTQQQQLEPEPEPCLLLAQHLPSAESSSSSSSSIQLQRLYIGAFGRGMGVGARLMRAVETVAREERRTNVWLQVSQGNLAAQKAYERWGFEKVGECVIDDDVGGFGQKRGWVMGKKGVVV